MKALSADSFLARLLAKLTAGVCRHPRWFFWPQVVLCVVCVVYALPKPYGQLDFDMNRDDLVGPDQKYHQNYLALHPEQPYIVYNDLPKLEHLHKQFPALYQ